MARLEWKPEFELGIADVDHEHRELIELIDRLCDSLRSSPAETSARLLGELYAQISAHFALEEKMMREREYDGYGVHKHDHNRLLDVLRDLMDEFEDGRVLDVDTFTDRLDAWFSDHFRTQDARLHRMIGDFE